MDARLIPILTAFCLIALTGCAGENSMGDDSGVAVSTSEDGGPLGSGRDAGSTDAGADGSLDAGETCATVVANASCDGVSECCGEGFYCRKPIGQCGALGTCAELETCSGDCDAWCDFCGCDGVSYTQGCLAFEMGISVAHGGKCDGAACSEDRECQGEGLFSAPDRYCAQPAGVCAGAEAP